MEKIAKKLTDYYMRKGLINEKDTAIYQFGWQVSIEIFISIIASVGIALYLKMFPEMIFLGGIFIPLRTWAGGVHLPILEMFRLLCDGLGGGTCFFKVYTLG